MIPDADLAAYADGELRDGARRRRLEAALASDPALAARLERHKALRAAAQDAYAPFLASPPHLVRMIEAPEGRSRRWTGAWWAPALGAAAAALAVGVALGWNVSARRTVVQADASGLHAGGRLARALETQLSADPGAVRIHFTTPATDGGLCRAFSVDAEGWAGLACRDAGGWRLVATAASPATAGGAGYRPAASPLPADLLSTADARRAGDALDRSGEMRARENGWKAP